MRQKTTKNFYVCYTILFLILAIIVFEPFWSCNKLLVWEKDGIYQHYNAFVYFGTWVRDILKTLIFEHRIEIPMWENSIGYGADVFTTLAYYAFGDPFSLISVFTPVKYGDIGYSIAIILRFYVAGIAFCAYTKKLDANREASLLGAMVYVFCSYALYAGVRHPFFLNPMINLPLVLLGVEKIFRNEKPLVYIVAVFVSAISNFYFFYMIVILTVVYVLARIFTDKEKRQTKIIISYIGRFAGYAIIGVMLAGILFLPIMMTFIGNSRISATQEYPAFYSRAEYETWLGSFVTGENGMDWAHVGMAPIAFLGVGVLVQQKKRFTWLKSILLFMFVCMLFPVAGHIFNGFGYVTNRWVFGFALMVCTTFCLLYPEFLQITKKQKIILGIYCVTYVVLCMLFEKARTKDTFIGCALLMIALVLVLGIKELPFPKFIRSENQRLFIVSGSIVAFSIIVMGYSMYGLTEGNYASSFLNRGEAKKVLYEDRAEYWDVIDDSEFYRIDNAAEDNSQKNFGLTTGQTTTSIYWSVVNQYTAEYLMDNSVYTGTSYTFKTLLSRSLLMPLASIKYYVAGNTKAQLASVPYGYTSLQVDGKDTGVYKSSLALPLGYTYDGIIEETDYNKMTFAQKQQAMLQGAVIQGEELQDASLMSEVEPLFNDESLPVEIMCGDGVQYENSSFLADKDNATVTLKFNPKADGELYVQFLNLYFQNTSKYDNLKDEDWENMSAYRKKKIKHELKYWVPDTDTKIIVSSGDMKTGDYHYEANSPYTCRRRDYFLNLAYSDKERNEIQITLTKRGIYTFDSLEVIWQPVNEVEGQVNALRENVLTDEQITTNHLEGTITTDRIKLLCLSIPYSEGWKITVDGKEEELLRTNMMFCGVILEPGEHKIEMTYCTPFIKWGAVLSISGCIIFTILVLVFRKNGGKRNA